MAGASAEPCLCILNAAAGSNRAAAEKDRLAHLFSEARKRVEIALVQDGGQIAALAKDAVARNSKLVLAGGGDGTMNAVANALVGSDTALGVLPLGTLNHFAKDMKIPLRLEDAIANVFEGRVTRIDVGEVNGKIFLNNSSLGLYPVVVQEREALQRRGQPKRLAFAQALVSSLRYHSPIPVRLHFENDRDILTQTHFVFVGNNRYELDALHIGQRSSLEEGLLWILSAPQAQRMKMLAFFLYALAGGKQAAAPVMREALSVTIHSKAKHLRVATDGEVARMASPLCYRTRPRALCVVAPPVALGASA